MPESSGEMPAGVRLGARPSARYGSRVWRTLGGLLLSVLRGMLGAVSSFFAFAFGFALGAAALAFGWVGGRDFAGFLTGGSLGSGADGGSGEVEGDGAGTGGAFAFAGGFFAFSVFLGGAIVNN